MISIPDIPEFQPIQVGLSEGQQAIAWMAYRDRLRDQIRINPEIAQQILDNIKREECIKAMFKELCGVNRG